MRCSTSRPDRGRARRRIGGAILILAGSIAGTAPAGSGADAFATTWTPRVRVDFAGGTESDLILDPTLDTSVVEGGGFAEVAPWLTLDGTLVGSTRLRLAAGGSLERFFNAEERWLSSQSLALSIGGRTIGPMRWRFSAGQNFFDDSQRDTVRRVGGWTELGMGPTFERVAIEVAATFGGRRYPQLTSPDDLGELGTYDDWSGSFRATSLIDLGSGAWLRVSSERNETYARDPLYDSTAWLHSVGLGASPSPALEVQASLVLQRRTFEQRIPVEEDEYLFANTAITYRVRPGIGLIGQVGFYRYTWPGGGDEDSYRLSAGVRLSWGDGPRLEALRLPEAPPGPPRANGVMPFRVHAPQAAAVSVVGTFNAWDPAAHPLVATGDGWWETSLGLAPGEYQYGYLIDGVFTTPLESEITVDDGFGGRNGWIEILP